MTSPMQSMKRFGTDALATPANFITLGRLLLAIPTLFLIERDGSTWLTWGLWFFLCATDSVDGWMARRDGTTRSGAFLDPIADKVLTLGGFIALVSRGDVWWLPVALMAARELWISIYRVDVNNQMATRINGLIGSTAAGTLASPTYCNGTSGPQTFDAYVRRVDPVAVVDALGANGFAEVRRYGIRAVTDLVADDARKHDPVFYADLLRLELALCDREPYLRTPRMWQLVARKTIRSCSRRVPF